MDSAIAVVRALCTITKIFLLLFLAPFLSFGIGFSFVVEFICLLHSSHALEPLCQIMRSLSSNLVHVFSLRLLPAPPQPPFEAGEISLPCYECGLALQAPFYQCTEPDCGVVLCWPDATTCAREHDVEFHLDSD